MPIFFNGRLWTTPSVMSRVDDSQMYNRNPSVGNSIAIIGRSVSGEPLTPLRFGSAEEARRVLHGGELLKAVEKAFDPSSDTVSPATIVAVRVNPATQATLTLQDSSSADAIQFTSRDYGLLANAIRIKVAAGTDRGLQLTMQRQDEYFTQNNIARECFSIQYTGSAASATLTITDKKVTLNAPSGTVVQDIDLEQFTRVEEVVDIINSTAGFSATVLDQNGRTLALNGLDFVSNVSVKTTPVIVTAHLQALVDWVNNFHAGFVTATRPAGAGKPPAPGGWRVLTGGTDGVVTNAEWQSAFGVLQNEDVQWVVPLSSSDTIHAMTAAHVVYASEVTGRERRAIVGGDVGATDAEAAFAARQLNSDRIGYTHLGIYDYDAEGKLRLYPPYIAAAQIAGAFAGVNPGTPMTNKTLKVRGIERRLRNPTDTDQLIAAGVLCLEETFKGYKVVQSVSTWQQNTNFNRVELSVGVACDYTARTVREALDDIKGRKAAPVTVALARERVETALRKLAEPEPVGIGVLVGDADSPPYRNIDVRLDGDVLYVEFECSPVLPINYIPITIHASIWRQQIPE